MENFGTMVNGLARLVVKRNIFDCVQTCERNFSYCSFPSVKCRTSITLCPVNGFTALKLHKF